MKKFLGTLVALTVTMTAMAQQNVTSLRIDNPSFEARFAGWDNNGFYYVINNSFSGKKGNVYMERWVTAGSKINDVEIKQTLVDLPAGTYTLVANCLAEQQSNSSLVCQGVTLYAGSESVAVNTCKEYQVVFTVLEGKADIGFKAASSDANWAAIDNLRLYYNGAVADSLHMELQKIITEAETLNTGGNGEADLTASVNSAKELLTSVSTTDVGKMAKELRAAIETYKSLNAKGNVPALTANEFVATGSTIALARMTYRSNGVSITERGFCWSTNPEPTILDYTTTRKFTNRGEIFVLEKLSPATVYYIRPYARTRGNRVAYGDAVKIATLPRGEVSFSYDYGGDADMDKRVASSLEEVKWLYNNLSYVRDFKVDAHYGAQTPTADCSYGGYMRIGPSESNHQTGVLLHETNHGVGVGTSNEWWNEPYRVGGNWKGPRATKMIQFLNNDPNAYMTGDSQHMWPISQYEVPHFGINGGGEDQSNPENTLLYYGNVLITHAMHQDGLICSSGVGFASPAYVMRQDDNCKYYIKNESEDYGNKDSYLCIANGALSISTAAMKDIQTDDTYAWYITYNPETAKYQFRNASTGQYITYTGSSFSLGADSYDLQLLPSWSDFKKGDLTKTTYWMVADKHSMQGADGKPTSATFSFNASERQRWLLLTSDEAELLDETNAAETSGVLLEMIQKVKADMAVEHVSKADGSAADEADKTLNDVISDIEKNIAAYSVGEIAMKQTELMTAFSEWLGQITPTSVNSPINITWLLTNPDFAENGDGWVGTPGWNYSCVEFYEKTFNFYQNLPVKMPAGTYKSMMQGYQRPGKASEVKTAYDAGTSEVKAYMMLTDADNLYIHNIWDYAQTKALKPGNTLKIDGLYIPDSMESAQTWFSAGYYDNVQMTTLSETKTLKVGLRSTKKDEQYWTIFDNFRLYYYGSFSQQEVATGISTVSCDTRNDGSMYNLAGQKVDGNYKGVVIKNGKKMLVK